MRKVTLVHVEVLNETEQILIFQVTFNKCEYTGYVITNAVRPIATQDAEISKCVTQLATMKTLDAKEAIEG